MSEVAVPESIRVVDLFAGIGGFHLAAASVADAECVFASEIDEDCRRVYRRNFGITPSGDIRPITEGRLVDVPDHDLLCAGFPCQPFSKSGHQRGIGETRGTLFYNILRVLEARRPRYVVLENVRNLTGPRHRETMATILRQLRSLGYRVPNEPSVLSPHLLPPGLGGRPQVRERVFILAEFSGEDAPMSDLSFQGLVPARPDPAWDPDEWRIADYLDTDISSDSPDVRLRDVEIGWIDTWNELLVELPVTRLPGHPLWADAFQARPQIPASLPLWKQEFLRKNSEFYLLNRPVIDRWLRRHGGLASFPESRRKLEWQAQDSPPNLWALVIHFRPSGIRVKRPTYLPALVAMNQASVLGWLRRRITPREAARLQAFPDDFVLSERTSEAYRQLGNAVNVAVAAYAIQELMRGNVGIQGNLSLGLAS